MQVCYKSVPALLCSMCHLMIPYQGIHLSFFSFFYYTHNILQGIDRTTVVLWYFREMNHHGLRPLVIQLFNYENCKVVFVRRCYIPRICSDMLFFFRCIFM